MVGYMKFGAPVGALLCTAALFCSTLPAAEAQEAYPSRAITFLVPYSAGGAPDVMARVVAQQLQSQIGHPVVVENRTGGNGGVAAIALAAAEPDGHTFMVMEGSILSVNRHLYADLAYDPDEDFAPVSWLGTAPTFLAVHPGLSISSFEEFIEYASDPANDVNYGSSGIGTPHHLSMAALAQEYELDINHIPYRGAGQSVPALLGGEVDALFASYSAIASFAEAGDAVLLVTNNIERTAEAADIPAISEFIPGFDFASRMGLVARAGTPQELIDRIAEELAAAMREQSVIERLSVVGIAAVGSTPQEYAEAIEEENGRIAAIVEALGIEPE